MTNSYVACTLQLKWLYLKLTKAILLLQFHLCYVRCCLIFKCFKCSNFNNCVSNFFNLVEVTQ